MGMIETTSNVLQLTDSIQMPRDVAALTADLVLAAAASNDGSVVRGEDMLSVLTRKLEATGVLTSGTADPVFADESALFYYQTTSETLFIRQTSAYAELSTGGASTPQVPSDWAATEGVAEILNKPEVPQTVEIGRSGITYSTNPARLQAVGNYAYGDFTVDSGLREFVTRYGGHLFIEAYAQLALQASVALPTDVTFRFEVLMTSGSQLTQRILNTITLRSSNRVVNDTVRIAGNLPDGITRVRLSVEVIANGGTDIGGVNFFRAQIRPDTNADEISVNRGDLGNNIANDAVLVTADDVFSQIDELPLQTADTYDIVWPSAPNGIDDNAEWVTRELPIERLLRIRNARAQQTFIAKIRYNSAYISGSRVTPPPETVNFEHRVWGELPEGLSQAQLQARSYLTTEAFTGQTDSASTRTTEVLIPAGAESITVGFKSASGQDDAKLAITDYHVELERGIDASGFTTAGRILNANVRSFQSLAKRIYDWIPNGENIAIAAAGFAGVLADTDNTAQKVAQKVNDLVIPANALGVPVDAADFSDPLTFPGGLKANLGFTGVPVTPANVQEALDKADILFQLLDNPFIANQSLDRLVATVAHYDFPVTSGSPVRTNPIDIPRELRDLGVPIAVRIRIRVSAIDTAFRGNLSIVHGTSFSRFGDTQPANGGGTTSVAAGDFITFQRIIPAANVPDTVRLQFDRTSSSGEATFHRGVAYLVDSSGVADGSTGQSATFTAQDIWVAGGTANSRLTGNAIQTLLGSFRFEDFDVLQLCYDNGSAAGMMMPQYLTAESFLTTADYGTIDFTDTLGYLLKPIGTVTNQFQFGWGNQGIRRIIGINGA